MARKVVESGVDTRELFSIEFSEDGYFAVRHQSPKFALRGDSIVEVAAAAERALQTAAIRRA